MATDLTQQNEVEAFRRFLCEELENSSAYNSLDEAVEAFRGYRRDLERFKKDIQPALEQSARGESKELDIEDVIARGMKRAADRGLIE